jgi:2-polyprenyl-6-methoxyphenol hydroxylase-like FAD-dependent oxidoreductase
MRVNILGAGPAGLYLGYLLKRQAPDTEIRIVEQNAPNATFGFGVVFSDRALEFLREDDPDTYAAITPHLESWNDITIRLRGEEICIDGIGFAAIGRLHLLQILQERLRSAGVEPVYNRVVKDVHELWSGAATKTPSPPKSTCSPTVLSGTAPARLSRR